jgi:uncharacterized protein YjbJ (UPF0337 family)
MSATGDRLKGKLKKAEGKLTGDRIRQGQGKLEEMKGDVEAAVDRAATRVKADVQGARSRARNRRRTPDV